TLARYDSALVPQPYLAESWSWSADRRSLVFHLRRDIHWHDGAPTTAADVVSTLAAARDPATGYPRQSELECLAGVRANGQGDVVLDFCGPQSRMPDVLTDLAILPERAFLRTTHYAPRTE